jgi:tetratricopeptide (TPR) repeat protein
VDLTSNAFKKDYRHLLNHIRNIIDICDLESDAQKKRRYNQEAMYAIQKSKRESTSFTSFSQQDFEKICMARLDSVNGLNYKAKKDFFDFTLKYDEQEASFPTELLADSISLMMKIGEFDKALEYSRQVKEASIELDEFTSRMLSEAQTGATENIKNVKMLNKKGIEMFTDGNLEAAAELFDKSLKIAPMNTGSALNLLQVLLAMIEQEPKKKWTLIERCKAVYKIVDGMPIASHHQKRMSELTKQFEKQQNS